MSEVDWLGQLGSTLYGIAQGDLTRLQTDAMVNAANAALAGGGGVDGAIHRAGGPQIAAACRDLPWVARGVKCPVGEVRTTPAGALQAQWVIHAVGPIYGAHREAQCAAELAQTYAAVVHEASRLGCQRVVVPCLSTGAFRYPARRAAAVAMQAVHQAMTRVEHPPELWVWAVFDAKTAAIYRALWRTVS